MNDGSYDAIVVGAGFGGSSCAAILAHEGLRVLLVDKNTRAGGKAMTVSKAGFTYELWPVIHAPAEGSVCEALLERLGIGDKVEILKPVRQGATYINDRGEYKRFPHDRTPDPAKIFDLLEIAEGQRPEAMRLLGELTMMAEDESAKLGDRSFAQWLSGYRVPRPLYSFLAGISNGVFMVPTDLLAASEAIRTIQAMFLRGGGLYCKGGIGRLAEAYTQAVRDKGGTVMLGSRVDRILVDDNGACGIETGDGVFNAPVVVSNAGLQPTVLKLVGERHFEAAYVDYVRELEPSWGMMGIRYFLDTVVLDEPYYMIFSDRGYWDLDRWRRAEKGELPPEVILWIEVPANFDPDCAPAGKQAVLTGVWCSPDPRAEAAQQRAWWDKIDEMMERLWPGFAGHVESAEHYGAREVSLLTRDQSVDGSGGECIGLGQIVGQTGVDKPAASAPLAGLFFVGTDAGGWGCGTHQAVVSGVNVASMVLGYREENGVGRYPQRHR